MELQIIVRVSYDTKELCYYPTLVADHVPLYKQEMDAESDFSALLMAHKAIEKAVDLTNSLLSKDKPVKEETATGRCADSSDS